MAKNCFYFKNRRIKNRRRDKKLIKSQQSLHKKKEKNSNHRHLFIMGPSSSSSNNASFTKIFEQIHDKDRGMCYSLRGALFLSFYFSLSRPRRTAEIIDNAFSRLDYISD